jgi:hypothetical protein
MKLTHLTVVGSNVPSASVEFGPRFTLVRGPSDTGKSFIVNAIDFMLGGTILKEIPERRGYSTVLLGLELDDGSRITLSRAVDGGSLGLHEGDVRIAPTQPPSEILSAKHSPTSETNLSRYLLKQLGLDGRRVRKNARNDTDTLSFRNLAHLCVVDEVQMQSEVPPALTGRAVSRTKEISVLRLLLEDSDDSDLIATPDTADRTRLADAKTEVFDQLIESLEEQLADSEEEPALREQLARLNATLEGAAARVSDLSEQRSEILEQSRRVAVNRERATLEHRESVELHGRLSLLLKQYESDLARLETLAEAGTLLGFFSPGVCVFCGAQPEAQDFNEHLATETTAFAESVKAEQVKTAQLRSDLVKSLADLDADRQAASEAVAQADGDIARLRVSLAAIDDLLSPEDSNLTELVSARETVQQQLTLYARIRELATLRSQVQRQTTTETAAAAARLSLATLDEFSAAIADQLRAWGYPDADDVRYDRNEQDLVAGSQLRSAHGKGVRAILHAGFTVGLAQYCLDRDISHPGFLVLDSPLVTYRAPGRDTAAISDQDFPLEFAGDFYRDFQRRATCQVIVMENTDPPTALGEETIDVVFTKSHDAGRYGFFPTPQPSAEN